MELPARFGVYELLELLGSGSFGEVFLARPVEMRRGVPSPVVIKRLRAELAGEERFIRRFSHEAELATNIDSPYVVKVYDAGIVDQSLFIAFEYIAGWPLAKLIDDSREAGEHMSIASIADIADDVLRGLAALAAAKDHSGRSLGVVHRDLAPKNLMLGEDGRVRVIDLGIGKSRLQDSRTRTGAILGTPGYMPPEQVLAEPCDHRSDLYAFGLVLFELLTLEPVIPIGSLASMLQETLAPRLRAPSSLRSEVPSELDRVVERALRIDPKERFQSAEEMRSALRAAVPARAHRENVSTLIGELLWSELSRAKTAVSVKLATARSETPAVAEKTIVFAKRPEVELSADVTLDPTFVPKTARRAAPAIGPRIAKTAVMIGAAIALVAAGIAIERARSSREAPAIPAEPAAPPKVGAVARPIPEAPPPPAVIEEPKQPAPAKRARPIAKTITGEPSPEPPPPPPPAAPADLDQLLERARSLRAEKPSAELDALLANLLRLRASARSDPADATKLERDLLRLETSLTPP